MVWVCVCVGWGGNMLLYDPQSLREICRIILALSLYLVKKQLSRTNGLTEHFSGFQTNFSL